MMGCFSHLVVLRSGGHLIFTRKRAVEVLVDGDFGVKAIGIATRAEPFDLDTSHTDRPAREEAPLLFLHGLLTTTVAVLNRLHGPPWVRATDHKIKTLFIFCQSLAFKKFLLYNYFIIHSFLIHFA